MSSRLRIGAWVASAAVGIASAALLIAVPAGAAPAGAAPADAAADAGPAGAPGNNGTVKIHEGAGEPTPEPRNEPHVCTFHVHAAHFDAGQVLTFTVQSWEPTGDRSVVLTGSITADGTGAGRAPVSGAYGLPDGHYRLTVDTGNGTPTQDKHKMFWVRCAAETTPPTTPSSPPPTCPTSPGCTTPPGCTTSPGCTTPPGCTPAPGCTTPPTMPSSPSTPGTPTTSVPSPTGTASPTPTVGSGAVTPPGTPPTAGGLALTGSSIVTVAGIGLALVLAGVGLMCTPARRRLLGR
jgi:hypothetical protein